MDVIVVSRCIEERQAKGDSSPSVFHFIGAYSGHHIKRILVFSQEHHFSQGKDYILHLKTAEVWGEELRGIAVRAKDLEDLRFI